MPTSKMYCAAHVWKARRSARRYARTTLDRRRRRRAVYVEAGRCPCGRPRGAGGYRCTTCAIRKRAVSQRYTRSGKGRLASQRYRERIAFRLIDDLRRCPRPGCGSILGPRDTDHDAWCGALLAHLIYTARPGAIGMMAA